MDRLRATASDDMAQQNLPPGTVIWGLIADTHIPSRASRLPDMVPTIFKRARVQAILHAGDIEDLEVLRTLEKVAPVWAVRGNTDWRQWHELPMHREWRIFGKRIVLTHGHLGFARYAFLRTKVWLTGRYPHRSQVEEDTADAFPQADVLIMGHTHYPVVRRAGRTLIINPGSPTVPPRWSPRVPPSVGILYIFPKGDLHVELVWW